MTPAAKEALRRLDEQRESLSELSRYLEAQGLFRYSVACQMINRLLLRDDVREALPKLIQR